MTRRRWLVLVASAVLVAGVGAAIWGFSARSDGAEAAAQRWLDALAAGDDATVTELVDDDAPLDAAVVGAFRTAAAYPEDPRIEAVTREASGRAEVRATAGFDGERREIFLVLSQASGGWRVTADFLGTAAVTTTLGSHIRIGEQVEPVSRRGIPLLPAVYDVVVVPTELLNASTRVAVSNDAPSELALDPQLSPDATRIAQEQLGRYEDACTRTSSEVPEQCGLRVPWAADLVALSRIAWRIDQRPTLTLDPAASTFAATGGVVVATATGTTDDGRAASFTYRADDWALRGALRFDAESMTLAVF